MALAEDEDFLSVAALQSETIKTVTAEESTGLTFKGKKFQVLGQGACDIFGAEIASGDSFNDLAMIQASKAGFLFRAPDSIKAQYPEIPSCETYDELLALIKAAL